ncbi:synaptonemal complex protein 3-like [Dipodomys merriami]|uniref:synaptonemal complex protein 3-like n=1 Tax=Dipodomys merriami TaxID=94247 RepID=UPI00385581D0
MMPRKRKSLETTTRDSKQYILEQKDAQDRQGPWELQRSQDHQELSDLQYSQELKDAQDPQEPQDPQNLLDPQVPKDHQASQDDSESSENIQAAENNEKDNIFLGTDEPDARAELQNMLAKFQENIYDLVSQKTKGVKMKVNASMKTIQDKIENTLRSQNEERQKLYEEYSVEFANLTELLKQDMEKVKEEGRKLASIFEQQIKTFQNSQNLHNKYMEAFEELYKQYTQSRHNIGDYEENDLTRELNSFRERMTQIQSKYMKEIEEKSGMLQSLLSLLSSQDFEDNEGQPQ